MRTESRWIDRGLFLLRVALGVVFVMHGWQKLAVYGHAGVAGMLASLGIPWPGVNAALLTAVEFGGGLAVLAGAATRASAALIAFSMAVAIATVHLANGFFLPQGYEFALTLLLAAVSLTLTGAGRYSVDALVLAPRVRPTAAEEWKLAA